MKKVYCKRTYFDKNINSYPINGKEYGEYYVKWACGKSYEFRETNGFDYVTTYLVIETEIDGDIIWSPITETGFNKYFETLDDYRNRKIEQILK